MSDTPIRQAGHDGRFLLNGSVYTKLATLGKGGSSLVYKVIGSKGQLFALKEINLAALEEANGGGKNGAHVPDYMTEVETLHALRGDPHVIQLHLAVEDRSSRFFYMLLECGGCDLDRHLATLRHTRALTPDSMLLPAVDVKCLWRRMLECVAALHRRSILHTDLKPVNFVFTENSTLKLIDFGIAKSVAVEHTSACFAKPVGTLNYMSPESLAEEGGVLRPSTDIWSLGQAQTQA